VGFGNTDWFTNDRFGMFIHWGLYALPARHEWVKKRERISTGDYQKYFDHFEPDLYNPKRWAADARAAGMKYAVITSKHHEGFCLWDSALTDYKVTNTTIGRDLLKEWVEAFRAEGLRVGFYHSVIDWHHPDFVVDENHPQSEDRAFRERERDRDPSKYADYLHGQTRELLTNYGKIDILWYDFTGPEKSRDSWRSGELVAMVRELQPEIILNDRIDYPESADFVTPEQYQPNEPPTRDGQKVVWEACQTLNGSWGYDRDNLDWKSPELLVRMLIDAVAKGGNMLLNAGPNGRGEFDPMARATLAEIGGWTRLHGRAIYGAGPSEFEPPADCRFTQRGNRLYLHVFSWPMRHIHLANFAGKVTYAQLLNDASEIGMTEIDPESKAQNTHMPGAAGELILELPILAPDVLVPVIELYLK